MTAVLRASAAPLAERCPPSPIYAEMCTLRGQDAEEGTSAHAVLAGVARAVMSGGVDYDASGAEPWLRAAAHQVWSWLTRGWPGVRALAVEQTIAIQVAGHTVTLTPDLVIDDNGTIEVIDWKTGKGSRWSTDRASGNLQLLAYAVGTRASRIRIVHVREWAESDGAEGMDVLDVTPEWLRIGIDRLTRTVERVAEARSGKLAPVLGEHCAGCYGAPACPAQQAAAAQALELTDSRATLTHDDYARLLAQIPALEKAIRTVKAGAKSLVRADGAPILTPDGQRWGLKTQPKREIDPAAALPVLRVLLGSQAAADCCTISVERVKDVCFPLGGKELQKQVLAELETSGAFREHEEEQFGWIK